jgi:multiple sugar transport system substrate-binding protein
MDLSSLIKTYKFDLNRLDPSIIPNVKVYGQGKIPFIPLFRTSHTLIYNKDIFDKFGVAYPPDGMTWDAATDLARKVTRTVDGVGYFGMGLDRGVMVDYNQLSISVVDPKTNKATVNNDQWKRVFETFKRFYDMPNSELPKDIFNIKDIFLKDKTLAMRVGHNQIYQLEAANKNGLNFDFASLPTFAEKPETGIQLILPSLMIPNTTKHKDLIFQMIAYLLSDEVQAQYSKTGYQSVLANSKVNSEFAKDLPWLQGKNVQAIIKLKVAATPPPGDYDIGTLNTELISSFKESVYNGKDVNTSLREAEERINKLIEEERKK